MRMPPRMAHRSCEDAHGLQRAPHPGLPLLAGTAMLLCSLVLMLSACDNFFATPTQSGTPTTGFDEQHGDRDSHCLTHGQTRASNDHSASDRMSYPFNQLG